MKKKLMLGLTLMSLFVMILGLTGCPLTNNPFVGAWAEYTIEKGLEPRENTYFLQGFKSFNSNGTLTTYDIYNDFYDYDLLYFDVLGTKDDLIDEYKDAKNYCAISAKYSLDPKNSILTLDSNDAAIKYGDDVPLDKRNLKPDGIYKVKYTLSQGSDSSKDTITLQFTEIPEAVTTILYRIDSLPAFK
ncbi:hypothetical protein [Eubacterium barkeri]|uniref:Lipoprotein n=1 Tax=Eubacterium barkeri TaxID=1528 RepID=A0A1H3II88_EUBBA|nr:hypothetical protein [Eubacterium barkeri]SDY27105.1 hypothetical protein SAMN04488579_12321 [Eubacterium barkeri]